MAIREIVLMGDPVLRAEAEPVTVFDDGLRRLVRDMFETMYHAEGIGLAAPQIGVSTRVVVVDLRRDEGDDVQDHRIALVNPVVTWSSEDTYRQSEGCLSIPELEEVVRRPVSVVVEGQDPDGNDVVVEADDLYGRALQHEIDHVNGILFIDRVTPLKRRLLLKKWRKLLAEEP
ncbi:MAG: peptide deformylase [Gemmatimonadetes bacterium]|nr:peptide deformylase [Gemmatimonadota bacterium]MDA1103097.1 peptide deformylase [Gemmatimonadota bacterium]